MTLIQGLFPYDPATTAIGPVRVLVAPITTAVPSATSGLETAFDQVGPNYAAKTGWKDLGATESATTYNRNVTTQELRIEQSTSVIIEQVTGLDRTLAIPLANYSMDTLAMFEATQNAVVSVPGATGVGTQKRLDVGTVTVLPHYRVLLVFMRDQTAGVVTEGNPMVRTRGRFAGFYGYQGAISAENSAVSYARSTLSTLPITLRLYAQDGKAAGQEHGFHLDEDGGQTIALT